MSTEKATFELADGGVIDYYHGFLSQEEADALWEACKVGGSANLDWKQGEVTVGANRRVFEPRLTVFLGEKDGLTYTYSEKVNTSVKWPALVEATKKRIEEKTEQQYNVVLMNWYQDGSHHVSWHADSETDLVKPTVIASLSLGATRPFQLRHKADSKKATDKGALNHRENQRIPDLEFASLSALWPRSSLGPSVRIGSKCIFLEDSTRLGGRRAGPPLSPRPAFSSAHES